MDDLTICSKVSWITHFLEQKLQHFSILSSSSHQATLCSGDGSSVSLPAQLLLASSRLARSSLNPGQDGQDVLLPSVRGSTLLLLVEILRSGKTSSLGTMDNLGHSLKEVQEVMTLLDMPGSVAFMRDSSGLKTTLKTFSNDQVRSKTVLTPQNFILAREELPRSLNPVVEVTKIKVNQNVLNDKLSPMMVIQDSAEAKVKDEEFIEADISGSEDGLNDKVKERVLPRECHICKKKYTNKDSLRSHIYTVHREVMFQCENCQKKFILESNLKKHVAQSHEGNRISCDHCKGTYRNKESWTDHMRKNHKNELIKCMKCDMHFFKDETLRIHVKNAHSQTGTPFLCGECPAKFIKKAKVQDHMRNVHSGVLFVCEQCTSTFSSKATLNRHMKTVHKDSEDMCVVKLDKATDECSTKGSKIHSV